MLAADLRKSVLQAAIQGKLTKQHDSDGEIDDLIDSINSERERLIKEKRVKKTKALEPIADEEIPFDIPDNWKWVRLGEVSLQITDGTHKTPKYITEGIPFLSVKNISKGFFDLNDVKYISEEEHQSLIMRCKPERNDLLFCRIGTIGKFKVIDIDLDFSIFVSLGLIKLSSYVYPKFMENVLNSPELYRQYDNIRVDGSHTGKLNLRDIPNLIIPLPPLEEQKRIVKKIDELMNVIKRYEDLEMQYCRIQEDFSDDLKKSILQAAMQGRLVEQIESEGDALDLIKEISEEKERLIKEKRLKPSVPLPLITDDDIPFDIPPSWQWVRHNELFEIIGGAQPPKSEFISEPREGYVRLYQTRDYGTNPLPVYIPITEAKKQSKKGDIILARYGGSLGKVFLAHDGAYNVALAKVNPLFVSEYIDKKFTYYYYLSPLYQSFVLKMSRSAQAGFNKEDLKELLFPLPPLAEQKRIVEKLEQLLPLCETLI